MTEKPLGGKAYGSIPHLPGSRRGPGDHGVNEGQFRICCERARDKHDLVIVQLKLDGSNVAAAKLDEKIVPLTRSGYHAGSSPYIQHQLWGAWVRQNYMAFDDILCEGEWLSGEWLAQAHGTRYDLTERAPFVAFDLWSQKDGQRTRVPFAELQERVGDIFQLPPLLHIGGPMAIDAAVRETARRLYGELDAPEGAVWRVERKGKVDFLAKYVRPDKVDGCYLESVTAAGPVWNWQAHP